MLVLLACALFPQPGAVAEPAAAPMPLTFGDAAVAITVAVLEVPRAGEGYGMNRCHLHVHLENRTPRHLDFADGRLAMEWEATWRQYDAVDAAGTVSPADASFTPVAMTAWGTMMRHAMIHHHLGEGLDASATLDVDVDLGRMYDLSLTRRYYLASAFSYRDGDVPRTLPLPRFEISPPR